ncbi:MAG: prephenate dehydrogenase/arogenate dehydrogenase family protein, partial [Propionibacteriaceae bacterium]|nr:prephenate dehydrogenase/arogenate dehydrogenase family protein [Propionibacteriaceae bacterium]
MTAVTDQPEPANSAGGHSADGAVLIIGAGLIGTSLGLALRQAGRTVYLSDRQTEIAVAAATLGAGTVYPAQPMPDPAELEADPAGLGPDSGESAAAPSPIELVVVAVQPDQVAAEVAAALLRFPDATVTDVSSVKGSVLAELIERGSDIRRYVGSHPMAGSQRSGPLAARADLFRDRTWVIAIHEHEDYARTALVE